MHSNFASHLYSFSRAAVTKYQNLDGLQQQEFIGSQFWKSEVPNQGVSRPTCSLTSLGESLPCLFSILVLVVEDVPPHFLDLQQVLTMAAQVQTEDTLKCCGNEWEGIDGWRACFHRGLLVPPDH